MSEPQQRELTRSNRGEVNPGAAKIRNGGPTDESPDPRPVPPENRPGHHPEHDQDKPQP
jgi:hypothetical protein